jgi:excisionase family DNA binding protein
MSVLTPRAVADRWHCSERHVRNLVREGQLRAFRLGGRLLRIPEDAVREIECRNTASDGCADGSASSSGETASGNVTTLEPLTRAKLKGLRQRSTQN